MVGYGRSRVEAPTHEIYGLFPSPVQLVIVVNNLRSGGAIRGSVEPSEEKGGESDVAIPRFSIFLCGSSRLCRLRTEGLVPVSKY
jgi:hypothetical protein